MVNLTFPPSEQTMLQNLGIQAVILFGSQAHGLAHATSDYDIAVIGLHTKAVYDTLYDLITTKINQLVDIDIVFLQDAPLELQKHVANYGQPLYLSSPKVFADFKQQVMINYSDFAPLRAIFSAGITAQI